MTQGQATKKKASFWANFVRTLEWVEKPQSEILWEYLKEMDQEVSHLRDEVRELRGRLDDPSKCSGATGAQGQ